MPYSFGQRDRLAAIFQRLRPHLDFDHMGLCGSALWPSAGLGASTSQVGELAGAQAFTLASLLIGGVLFGFTTNLVASMTVAWRPLSPLFGSGSVHLLWAPERLAGTSRANGPSGGWRSAPDRLLAPELAAMVSPRMCSA